MCVCVTSMNNEMASMATIFAECANWKRFLKCALPCSSFDGQHLAGSVDNSPHSLAVVLMDSHIHSWKTSQNM